MEKQNENGGVNNQGFKSFQLRMDNEDNSQIPWNNIVKSDTSRKRSGRAVFISVVSLLAIVALVGVGMGAHTIYSKYQQKQHETKQLQQESDRDTEIQSAANPFTALVDNKLPVPVDGTVTASVEPDRVYNGAYYLDLPAELKPTVNGCSVTSDTDFCMVASGEFQGTAFNLFMFKDIANNRFLSTPSSFQDVKVNEGDYAAVMNINMGGGKDTLLGAVAHSGSSVGYVFMFPDGTESSSAVSIIRSVRYE